MFRTTHRLFSTYKTKVAIIGAGAGGHNLSSQLMATGNFEKGDVTIFDPKTEHHYQPGYTGVAGGIYGDAQQTKQKERGMIVDSQERMFKLNSKTEWVQKRVDQMKPEQNKLVLQDGTDVEYEYLVVSPGCQLRFDMIKGAAEAIEDEQCPVGSIYTLEGAYKTARLKENFKGGNAVFTLPTMPIKCGGAPQKIMYLCEEKFRESNVRDQTNVLWHTTADNMFPNCKKFADALAPIAQEKGIEVTYKSQLVEVDKDNRVAKFKNLESGEVEDVKFDFLHLAPPQTAPEFVRNSPLAAANGWLDVDINTLQHNKYKNVFGLGDVCNLPTAKTAAAIFSQTPVLLHNIQAVMNEKEAAEKYNGYSSCPLFVGNQKLMLIEFKYGGEPDETFGDQSVPAKKFYWMKKSLFPAFYWGLMPRGQWFGRDTKFFGVGFRKSK